MAGNGQSSYTEQQGASAATVASTSPPWRAWRGHAPRKLSAAPPGAPTWHSLAGAHSCDAVVRADASDVEFERDAEALKGESVPREWRVRVSESCRSVPSS